MKKLLFACAACLMYMSAVAQNVELANLIAKGKKVFVEFEDVRGNIDEKEAPLVERLSKLNYWEVVTSREEADFILRTQVEKKGSKALLTVRLFCTPSILSKEGEVLWTGKVVKGATPQPVNGYNAYYAMTKRLIKQTFEKELGLPVRDEE